MEQQITDEQLWQLAEGLLTDSERKSVEQRITEDTALQERARQIEGLHQSLRQMEPDMPSLRFTQNVLDQLPVPAYRPALTYYNHRIIGGVAVLFAIILLLAGVCSYTYPDHQSATDLDAGLRVIGSPHVLMALYTANIFAALLLLDTLYRKAKSRRLQL